MVIIRQKRGLETNLPSLNTGELAVTTDDNDEKLYVGTATGNQQLGGKAVADHAGLTSGNPHNVTKSDVSLGNVTNDAQLKRGANDFTTFTAATPAPNDVVVFEDTSNFYNKKQSTVGDMVGAIVPSQATEFIYVDSSRSDSYTADGTINKPYKTLSAALAVPTADGFTFMLAPGSYTATDVSYACEIRGSGGADNTELTGNITYNSAAITFSDIEHTGVVKFYYPVTCYNCSFRSVEVDNTLTPEPYAKFYNCDFYGDIGNGIHAVSGIVYAYDCLITASSSYHGVYASVSIGLSFEAHNCKIEAAGSGDAVHTDSNSGVVDFVLNNCYISSLEFDHTNIPVSVNKIIDCIIASGNTVVLGSSSTYIAGLVDVDGGDPTVTGTSVTYQRSTKVSADTTDFDNILDSNDNTVQDALGTLDDHVIEDHTGTTATGANLNELTGGGATSLHTHTGLTPGTHADTHENGGGDEISVEGLSGELADPQNPFSFTTAVSGPTSCTDGNLYDNIGATGSETYNLPAATRGARVAFAVVADQTMEIVAQTGDVIHVGDQSTSTNRKVTSQSRYSTLTLEAFDDTNWIATAGVGDWTTS